MHDANLIATIAIGLGLAFILGLLAARLRMPPLVGYLVAGIIAGPYTPLFVVDVGLAQQLSEIGVILLMFGVGIHFSPADLLSVRRIAVPGALVQILMATALGALVSHLWGWSWGSGIVFGLCLSVASTVVLLRALEDRQMLDSVDGRIAVGWLVVEDLVTVVVLVLLPALAVTLGGSAPAAPDGALADGTGRSLLAAIGITLAKVAAFVVLMFVVGRRAVPWLLERVARIGSRELFTLAVLAVAIGIAVGAAELFDVSFALGAFFAGMVVNGSDLSHEAAADALPLQEAFSVLFFVAVGMLFDPRTLMELPLQVLAVVLIVLIGKSVAALMIVLLFRYSLRTAFTISASLAQIGEFSFILAALAVSLNLLPNEGQSLIVAGALLSITLNPAVFASADWLVRRVTRHPRLLEALERPAGAIADLPAVDETALSAHAIIVGYGRVGSVIGSLLGEAGVPFVVMELNREIVEQLRKAGVPAFFGDASRRGVLSQAHPERARTIVITAPDPFQARAIIQQARRVNAAIESVIRTHTERERAHLEREGLGTAVLGERELALTMARHALMACGAVELPPEVEVRHTSSGAAGSR
ncbi:MAG TPA: YbaL family putative K(+) efflux transporter [Gemmatimonadaceae bacterium]|nr:YbaL family putative K(+) efflux transporter [Gemmatimonadaceae bacterium]